MSIQLFNQKYSVLRQMVAASNGLPDDFSRQSRMDFALTPDVEALLNHDATLQSGFLNMCNVEPRKQLKGNSLRIGPQRLNTRTNDTQNGDPRRPGTPTAWAENEYELVSAHSDFKIHDRDRDTWSQFPNFAEMYRQSYMDGINDDRLIVGFHGTSHVVTSDITTNPMMQDVNVGWFELLKTRNPANFITEGGTATEIRIATGTNDDYANLDECISDLRSSIPVHRRKNLIAVVGSSIIAAAQGKLYKSQGLVPTEKERIMNQQVIGMYGGLITVEADFFPDNAIMVTALKMPGYNTATRSNLSIFYQEGSWRRVLEYKAEIESLVDWNARMEGYHIEDLEAIKVMQAATFTMGTTVIAPDEADFVAAYS
jgi:P2 family phage major capsid protein